MPFLLLYIYIYIPPLYSRATFNRAHSLYGLIPILFHPRNKPAFDLNVVSLLPPEGKKGKPGLKIEGRGKKSSRPIPFRSRSSSTRLFTRGVANYSTREGIRSKASSNHPVPGTRYHCKRSPPLSLPAPLQSRRVYLA